MIEWTEDAEKAFQEYVNQMKCTVESMEADPSEVAEDLRRHIEEELGKGNSTIITEEDVRGVMKRMGMDRAGKTDDSDSRKDLITNRPFQECPIRWWQSILMIGFGVVLPFVALGIEISERWCTDIYVDPIPSIWHIFLIALVPLTNLVLWMTAGKTLGGFKLKALGWASGISIGIALFYTLVFLPIMPSGIMLIIGFGMGLLPLAPVLALSMAIWLRDKVSKALWDASCLKMPGYICGLLLGMAILIGLSLPVTLTRVGLKLAVSEQAGKRVWGMRLLDWFGNDETMIRYCYQRPSRQNILDPLGGILTAVHPATPQQAREIVYRITGRPFTSFPHPGFSSRPGPSLVFRDFELDSDQDDPSSGIMTKGVSLSNSRLDGSIAPNAALGYLEWTLEFKNDVSWQQEARGQIVLPPGGVVSRLTLWVNGEEREAAFGSRAKTRQAYQQVVQRRRDPVLVTTCGKDRVAFQCFPVPPNGGTMKIRLGITYPLVLPDKETALLRLPYFSERNFKIEKDLRHSVWIESKQPFQNRSRVFLAENPKPELFAVRGNLSNADLFSATGVVFAVRNPEVVSVWAPDLTANDASRVRQTIKPSIATPPSQAVIVMDGSVSMQPWVQPLVEAFSKFPTGIGLTLIHAGREGDEVIEPNAVAGDQASSLITSTLPSLSLRGGCDNTEALNQAWDIASGKSGSVILWIHGPQPVLLGNPEILIQKWERRPDGPKLLSLQVVPGPDKVMEKLDGLSQVNTVVPLEGACEDLKRLFKQWSGEVEMLQFHREKITSETGEETGLGPETSMHLVRLWAKNQIETLRAQAAQENATKEISMASAYKLVTPLMGAVVLENDRQYQVAGLKVPDAQGIPTIPEPETWMLIMVVLLLLVLAAAQQRRNKCCQG